MSKATVVAGRNWTFKALAAMTPQELEDLFEHVEYTAQELFNWAKEINDQRSKNIEPNPKAPNLMARELKQWEWVNKVEPPAWGAENVDLGDAFEMIESRNKELAEMSKKAVELRKQVAALTTGTSLTGRSGGVGHSSPFKSCGHYDMYDPWCSGCRK